MSYDRHSAIGQVAASAALAVLVAAAGGAPPGECASEWPPAVAELASPGSSFSVTLSPRVVASTSEGGDFRVLGTLREESQREVVFSDGFESGDTSAWSATYPAAGLPAGTVLMFDLSACPAGWSLLTAAAGRTLVGVPAGGSIGGVQGSPLGDLGVPSHVHSFSGSGTSTDAPPHNHWWSILWTDRHWTTYDVDYNVHTIFEWGDGIDDSGVGYYPYAAAPNTNFGTSDGGGHEHAFNMSGTTALAAGHLPYLQLLVCQKD